MRIKVIVTPKPGVLDPQGQAIQRSLVKMGHQGVTSVRQGKYFELELDNNGASRGEEVRRIAERVLSNPLIETFEIEEER